LWFVGGGVVHVRPRSRGRHRRHRLGHHHHGCPFGRPPVICLLPLGLSKALYAGTTSIFFTVDLLSRVMAGGRPAPADPDSACQPARSACWAGWRLRTARPASALRTLLTVTAIKLLWDGLHGYGLV
jgi:hypothetical protein